MDTTPHVHLYYSVWEDQLYHGSYTIGGGNTGLWSLLSLRSLHRIISFAIENHLSLQSAPLLSLSFSPSVA